MTEEHVTDFDIFRVDGVEKALFDDVQPGLLQEQLDAVVVLSQHSQLQGRSPQVVPVRQSPGETTNISDGTCWVRSEFLYSTCSSLIVPVQNINVRISFTSVYISGIRGQDIYFCRPIGARWVMRSVFRRPPSLSRDI